MVDWEPGRSVMFMKRRCGWSSRTEEAKEVQREMARRSRAVSESVSGCFMGVEEPGRAELGVAEVASARRCRAESS